jgi:large subunit ribosomal protein L15
MELNQLKYARGSRKKMKRIGRGEGSGHGGTSTKGHKGLKSRSGNNMKAWFEGGQMPLQRRLPKFGFVNIFKKEFQIVNLAQLTRVDGSKINGDSLHKAGLITHKNEPVKVLGNGDLSKALDVEVHAISESAKAKIEKAGGKVTVLGIKRTRLEKKKKKK